MVIGGRKADFDGIDIAGILLNDCFDFEFIVTFVGIFYIYDFSHKFENSIEWKKYLVDFPATSDSLKTKIINRNGISAISNVILKIKASDDYK